MDRAITAGLAAPSARILPFRPRLAPPPAQRIAILFQDFAAGGTERIMVRLANEWAKSRDVLILCGSEQGPAREAVSDAVSVRPLSPAVPRSLLSRWTLGRRFGPILDAWRPDVIVGPGNHVVPILLALGQRGAPVVCKLSNPVDPVRSLVPGSLLAWLRRGAFAPVSHIVAMSPSLRDEAAHYLRTERIHVLPEPILPDIRAVVPRKGARRTRLLFAGRLVAQKNVALAIRALAALPADISLTIVGDGPERGALERLALRLDLATRVRFMGHVADIRPHLATADIFVLPSRFEGYPAVLIEALAAGLPIVSTPSSPALPEIIAHPSFGRIAPADPAALAGTIRALEGSAGPDPIELALFLGRHRLEDCAAGWLALLDEAARRDRDGG